MAVLVMRAFPHDDPDGTHLGQFSEAVDKQVLIEDNGVGSGSFRINRDSSEASWCGRGNYVRAWRDVAAGQPLAGFWITERSEVVLSEDEQGGEDWTVSGPGPIHCLTEAIVWHREEAGTDAHVQRGRGRWLWTDAHPARPLVRMLEEAQARGCIPFVSWDFTRDLDSDGNPWTGDKAERISLEMGKSLLWVVDLLRETGLHIVMGPNFVLKAWDQYENDLSATIEFTEGVDIRETSERQVAVRRAKGVVLVEGEVTLGEGDETRDVTRYRAVNDPDTQSDQGRRTEGFYQYTRTTSRDLLQRVGKRKLKKWRKWREGPFTLGVIDKTGQVAMVDYVPGDTVAIDVPGSGLPAVDRISTITLHDIENGEYDPVLSFGDDSVDSDPGDDRLDPGSGDAETREGTFPLDAFQRGVGGPFEPVDQSAGASAAPNGSLWDVYFTWPATGWKVGNLAMVYFVWVYEGGGTAPDSQIVTKMENAGFEHSAVLQHPGPDQEGHYSASAWFWRVMDGTEYWWLYDGQDLFLDDIAAGPGEQGLQVGAVIEFVSSPYVSAGLATVDVASAYDESDPPSLAANGSYPAADAVRYYAGLYDFSGQTHNAPTGYTLVGESTIDAYEQGASDMVAYGKDGTNSTEDPSDIGITGDGAWTLRLRGTSGSGGLLGSVPTQAMTGSPWQGGNPWVITSDESDHPEVIDIVNGELQLTAETPSRFFEAHIAPPPWLPHQREEWTTTVDVRMDGTIVTADAGQRYASFTVDSDDRRATYHVRWGDLTEPDGIYIVVGGGGDSYTGLAIDAAKWYRFRFGMVGGLAVAKVWEVGDPEPSDWQASSAVEDDEAADWFELESEHGGESGDLTLRIRNLDATLSAGSGDKIARHIVGYGDGTAVWFDTVPVMGAASDAYAPGSLKVWVDNQPVEPVAQSASDGRFRLSRAPYGDPEAGNAGSAVIEAAYTKA